MRIGSYLIWVFVAGVTGALVLLGYFVEEPLVEGLGLQLMQWSVLLAAAALLVGLVNLVSVHINKIGAAESGSAYSLVLVVLFVITFAIGLILGADHSIMRLFFNHIQLPVEASLMALLAVTLVVAGFRLLRRSRDLSSIIFLLTVLTILLVSAPWPLSEQGFVGDLRAWIRFELTQVLAVGGARGILIGVALGAVLTGLRVLIGAERPYGE